MVFVVTSTSSPPMRDDDNDSGLPSRQDSLLPGQIHHPTMQPPTPFLDWTRGDSQLWETAGSQQQLHDSDASSNNGGGGGGAGKSYDIWGSNDSNLRGQDSAAAAQDHLQSRLRTIHDYDDDGRLAGEALLPQAVADEVGSSPHDTEQLQVAATFRSGGGSVGSGGGKQHPQHRSSSEVGKALSEELHIQARLFPPPPPPFVPMESRRNRADLWYYYASKWDITLRLPPPPRNPLAGMEEEHKYKLQELTRVPYRGDRWLARCEFWHQFVQASFEYPPENQVSHVFSQTIYDECVLE